MQVSSIIKLQLALLLQLQDHCRRLRLGGGPPGVHVVVGARRLFGNLEKNKSEEREEATNVTALAGKGRGGRRHLERYCTFRPEEGRKAGKGREEVCVGFNVIDRGFVTHVRVSRAKFGRGVGIPVRKTPCAVVVCC